MLLSSAILIVVGVELPFWRFTRPVASSLAERVSHDGVILQTSGSSCVPATCANISRFYGVKKSEKEMAKALGTTVLMGTRVAQILYGMKELGFNCQKIHTKESDLNVVNPPALLFVDHPATGPESHAVSYMGNVGVKVEILDPLFGKLPMDIEQLRRIWHGKAIEIRR